MRSRSSSGSTRISRSPERASRARPRSSRARSPIRRPWPTGDAPTGEPWRSTIRAFNLRIAGSASIGVNTFPSGHAAEALAAALLVLDAPLPVVTVMFLNALAISAGAVLGRYHYAADALSGWLVALAVWFAMRAGGAAL